MKVMLLVVLGAAAALSAVSAGGKADSGAKSGKLVIANTPKCIGIAWWDRMEVGNKRYVAATGNEVYQSGPVGKSDPAVQLSTVQDAIATGIDALTVIPSSPESLDPVLKQAMDQGIVVISHEAINLRNVHYDIEAFVNEDYGAHMMDVLAKEMGETGGYMIMVGMLTMTSHQQWAEGAIKRQKEKYPNMFEIAPRVEGQAQGGGQEGSYLVAKEVIAKYPTMKGFIGMDMVNTPGIAMAVEEAGKSGQIKVTGTSLVSATSKYLESGTIKTIMFWDPAIAGEAMCKLAEKVIKKEPIGNGLNLGVPGFENCSLDGKIIYGSAWVDATKANMSEYNF
jgi:simple sugar transport system substrate-binding protein